LNRLQQEALMVVAIGKSTDPSTVNNRIDVSGTEPASFRYNNAGAQYPSKEAARFGQLGYGVIGGNHKIARFPSPVNGAASNFDLLVRNYTGMSIGAAGRKWTGANGFGIPGYDPDQTLTQQMLRDTNTAIELLKAIAGRESGRGNNLTEVQWQQAHKMFRAGSADAYFANTTKPPEILVVAGSKTGAGILRRALEHIGDTYENILVPKDDAGWKGPWDCAEFTSWLIYQEAGILYGCTDDNADPSRAEAYTGAWQHDVERLGIRVSVKKAAGTEGGILLRYPPAPGKMGHIAICDGRGGTVEAKGRRYGVVEDVVSGRKWHTGILINGIEYGEASVVEVDRPVRIYDVDAPNMDPEIILEIQRALSAKGFNHFSLSGQYDKQTQMAVAKFQEFEGLVTDGAVGPETSSALGITLSEQHPKREMNRKQTRPMSRAGHYWLSFANCLGRKEL
jgi:peptidoglycan hydrolase-like protein with peptidoglycan-binding domain